MSLSRALVGLFVLLCLSVFGFVDSGLRGASERAPESSLALTAPIQQIAFTEPRPTAPTEQAMTRAAMVWARLIEVSSLTTESAPSLVFDRDAIAHSQSSGEVFFGPSLLERSDDELAFALAHELAHFLLGHHGAIQELARTLNASESLDVAQTERALHSEHWLIEFEADARAAALLQRAGFEVAAAARYLGRHALPDGRTHPGTDRRAQVLGRL
jgi:hypothetical protein